MRSKDKSLDHVIPLVALGAHSISNVVICCKSCNARKGARLGSFHPGKGHRGSASPVFYLAPEAPRTAT